MAWIWSIDPLRSLVGCSSLETGEEFKVSYKRSRLDYAIDRLQNVAGATCLPEEYRALLEKGRSRAVRSEKAREHYRRRHATELSRTVVVKKPAARIRPHFFFECDDCGATFPRERDAREHTQKVHESPQDLGSEPHADLLV